MILNQQWAQDYSYNHGSIAASYILYNGTLKKTPQCHVDSHTSQLWQEYWWELTELQYLKVSHFILALKQYTFFSPSDFI